MKWRSLARGIAREPLVHFLVAGAAVFALLSGRPADPSERRIVVDEALVARLVDRWTMTYRRMPTQAEIDGLIRDHVADQIYYREALRLGLDRDDEVVIRRMRVKMLALASSEAEIRVPRNEELQRIIDADPRRYAPEPRLDFEQIYLGEDDEAARARAGGLLARLNAGKLPLPTLPPAPITRLLEGITPSEIAERFGGSFADTVRPLSPGKWHGPISSGFGLHLVRVERLHPSVPPRLADIRRRVENDWRAAEIERAEDARYREMAAGYDVVIEPRR